MHLVEVVELRGIPAAGLFVALTRRCPLSCAHCSTNSTLASEESPAEMFVRFVDTFRVDNRPEVLMISGGEAFLRPALVQTLAERASVVGCRTIALSGMFWARGRRIPPPIRRAIDALAHFSVSLDVFHEREVAREHVYHVLETLLAEGKDVSIHLVGLSPDDPYLAERTEEVQRIFGGRVPMIVNGVNPAGRAARWLQAADLGAESTIEPNPCTRAAWPLVAFDGTIVGCSNDDVVDGPAPPHLRLGHAATDAWPDVRARSVASSMLRAIRTFGPEYVADRHSPGAIACNGYCSTCQQLSEVVGLDARVEETMTRAGPRAIEEQVISLTESAGAESFVKRYGMPKYADLVALGYDR